MRKVLILIAPFAVLLAGCGQSEEPAEPLSPDAQAALKSGQTGPPAEARGTDPQANSPHKVSP